MQEPVSYTHLDVYKRQQLPIRADFVGKNVPSAADENVRLFLEETDGKSEVEILEIAPGSRAGSAPLGGE